MRLFTKFVFISVCFYFFYLSLTDLSTRYNDNCMGKCHNDLSVYCLDYYTLHCDNNFFIILYYILSFFTLIYIMFYILTLENKLIQAEIELPEAIVV